MKRERFVFSLVSLFVAVMLVTAWSVSPVFASGSKFMVIAAHTPEACLKVLDDVSAKGKMLAKFDWGCMANDHTGYMIVEAKDEAAVKAMLPETMKNAKVVKLTKFTAEQIKSFHEKK